MPCYNKSCSNTKTSRMTSACLWIQMSWLWSRPARLQIFSGIYNFQAAISNAEAGSVWLCNRGMSEQAIQSTADTNTCMQMAQNAEEAARFVESARGWFESRSRKWEVLRTKNKKVTQVPSRISSNSPSGTHIRSQLNGHERFRIQSQKWTTSAVPSGVKKSGLCAVTSSQAVRDRDTGSNAGIAAQLQR